MAPLAVEKGKQCQGPAQHLPLLCTAKFILALLMAAASGPAFSKLSVQLLPGSWEVWGLGEG